MSRQPSKSARGTVNESFDADALKRICVQQDFSQYAEYVKLSDGRFYWHRDNGSDVLAVAHLDHVQADAVCSVTETAAGLLACSGALDDRLGAYVILDMLPKLGIQCDILLTTDEEVGRSTAEWFETEKQYNWVIEFDRGGTDVVMYDYETPELCRMVEECGAKVGQGSFSDICVLDHLGCAGFNWGVGYQDYHSARSHAWLDDTFRIVARFVKFYNAQCATFLPYDAEPFVSFDDDDNYDEHADVSWWRQHLGDIDDDDLQEWCRSYARGDI